MKNRQTIHYLKLKPLIVFFCFPLIALMCSAANATDADELVNKSFQVTQAAITVRRINPPVGDDNFLIDVNKGDSPGLDTGCTFNTSSLNPLTINIEIDKSVGEVDAEGYLLNPDPLIDAGIIPAKVYIKLPAYDVDTPQEKMSCFLMEKASALLRVKIRNGFPMSLRFQ